METYGSDKPDLRYGLKLIDLKHYTDVSEFRAFSSAERVKGIIVNDGEKYSRKMIDDLTDFIKKYKAKGLAWMKFKDNSFYGGISKFFSAELQNKMQKELYIKNGDMLFMVGDQSKIVLNALGHLRNEIAKKEELINKNKYCPIWVTDCLLYTSPSPRD